MRRDGWLSAAVLANVAVSVVFAVLTLAQAPFDAAGYALVRAIVLLGAGAVVAVRRRPGESLLLAWIATAVQLGDAIVGLHAGELAKTIGPIALAVLTAARALRRTRAHGAARRAT